MLELNQKKFNEKRRFKLTESGIETYTNDLDVETNTFFSYDEFSNETRIYTEKFPKILYIGLSMFVLAYIRVALLFDSLNDSSASATLLILLGSALTAFYYIYQKKYKLLCLDNDQQVFIFSDSPNEKKVDEFIKTFYEMRKADYRKRYFKINFENDPKKEIERMNWLLKEEIITQSEYDFMIEEIQIKFL
ncbi:hypothetical protein [Flavobacterium capsici]|uniref:Uncharacterized protein n=1 Tax=Flavobacterium capsici TaxID=3075618 RepID=A0AA96J206_9FLAO|nr:MULTISPECIES: hypothetical protein [unclassified Flavobacterium]WNM18972.1 hypothetical protein RN608_13275 [Flavobacterium sp. PMR2A8]WNM23022.1 hypothetical protein RN605_06575 [Flavobacterium sp. PMTSA4]